MSIIRKKSLNNLSKLVRAEEDAKERREMDLNIEENQKLQRFGLYHIIRREKYLRQGGNPTFGNPDGQEYTIEEFEYHLSHCLMTVLLSNDMNREMKCTIFILLMLK